MLKKILGFFVLCLIIVPITSDATIRRESIHWISSHDQAQRAAYQGKKIIMIYFHDKNSQGSKKLEKETYKDKNVVKASKNFICLKIDCAQNRHLAKKYKVKGYPAIIFVDSNGNLLAQKNGYRNANKLLAEMHFVRSKSYKPNKQPHTNASSSSNKYKSVTKSSTGRIGAFAKNWWWSKDRQQDGEYGETKITIELPKRIKKAILVLEHSYSQRAGSASAKVYISNKTQVTPKDQNHHKGGWWVGNNANLGRFVGSFETSYTGNPLTRLNVIGFLKENHANAYYVTVQNLDRADIGLSKIYLEIAR